MKVSAINSIPNRIVNTRGCISGNIYTISVTGITNGSISSIQNNIIFNDSFLRKPEHF